MSLLDTSYKSLMRIAWPVVISEMSYGMMGLIDTIMVGQLGVEALAGVGLANMIHFWLLSFFIGLLSTANSTIAQAIGAGDANEAGKAFWQSGYLGLLCVGGCLLWLPFIPTLYAWTGGSAQVQAIASEYTFIRVAGAAGFMLLVVSESFYKGLGETRALIWMSLSLTAINALLNYMLIFGNLGAPKLGTGGAALGSVIAHTVVAVGLFISVMLRRDLHRFDLRHTRRFDAAAFRVLLRMGLPVGVQQFVEMAGVSVFLGAIARLGDEPMAATNAVMQAWNIAYMYNFAISVAATTLAGHCIGAGLGPQARGVIYRALALGLAGVAPALLAFLTVPEAIMGIFIEAGDAARILPFAAPLFAIMGVSLVFSMPFSVISGGLRGAGDTTYSMAVTIGAIWLILIPGSVLAAAYYDVYVAWWVLAAYVFAGATLLFRRLRGDAWLQAGAARGGPDAS